MVQQQQPRLPAQKFGRPSTQQPPRQQFTGQQSFTQNQNAQTNTQLSGPRQSTVSTITRSFYNQHFFIFHVYLEYYILYCFQERFL